jgi:membrane protein
MHRTILSVLDHGGPNLAQSTAYAGMVALFPALIVAAALIGLLPDNAPLRFQLSAFFDRILPPDVSPVLDAYFQNRPSNTLSVKALLTSGFFSVAGASNVIVTLMEGLQRAQHLTHTRWGFWARRRRSLLLVVLSLVPFALASVLVIFGQAVNSWIEPDVGAAGRTVFVALGMLVRWTLTLGASVWFISILYRLGVPSPGSTARPGGTEESLTQGSTLPGAVVATAMWFLATLIFGWYVTRFANYSEIYGSLGAGIALLFWLYLISLSILCGAEFNANFNTLYNLRRVESLPRRTEIAAAGVLVDDGPPASAKDSPAHTHTQG